MPDETVPLYHSDAWKSVLQRIYRCLPMDDLGMSGGQRVMPIYLVRSLLSGYKLTNGPFMFYPDILGCEEALAGVLEKVTGFMAKRSGFVEVKCVGDANDAVYERFGFVSTVPALESVLPLDGGYDDVRGRYGKSLRQNLRTTAKRADEAGVRFGFSDAETDIRGFYDVFARLYRDKHRMVFHPFAFFNGLLCRLPGSIRFLLAKRDHAVLAGIVLLNDRDTLHYAWAASGAGERRLGLNTLLVDKAVEWACAAGMRRMVYGSTPVNDEKLIYFKRRWGCGERPVFFRYYGKAPAVPDLNDRESLSRRIYSHVPLRLLKPLMRIIVPQLV